MDSYLAALNQILTEGEKKIDRTGVGTLSVFGEIQLSYNLKKAFPATTTKQLAWKGVLSELLWFLEGSSDERRLAEILYGTDRKNLQDKTTIWTANAKADYWKDRAKFEGDLGPVYGVQWRSWVDSEGKKHDQVSKLIHDLKHNPHSRRHIISAWNVGELDNMALPPCHLLTQFYVTNDGHLECKMYQRSADFFLGVPFNIASYAIFVHLMAHICGLKAGKLILTFGDAHIYNNHVEAVKEQLSRKPSEPPTLWVNPELDFNNLTMNDFKLIDYKHQGTIKAPMAV